MKKLFLFITFLAFTSLTLKAQTGSVRGRVVDGNNLSLPGASVYTNDMKVGTITDVNGDYVITGLSAGDYKLNV